MRLVLRDFKPEINDLQAFSIDTAEADFLFEPEISEYLSAIYHGAWRLRSAKDEYRDFTQRASPDYDHNKGSQGNHHSRGVVYGVVWCGEGKIQEVSLHQSMIGVT